MSSLPLEYVLVALAGLWSICYLTWRWLPFIWQPLARAWVKLLQKAGLTRLADYCARTLQARAGGECGSGCKSCSTGCSTPLAGDQPQPVQWRSR